jgi:hypothetical protein
MPLWIRRKYVPTAVTVVTTVKKERVENLRAELRKLNLEVRNKTDQVFCKLEGVHYARWIILEEDGDYPVSLVYSVISDLAPRAHFTNLLEVAGDAVRRIYEQCEVPFDATTRDDIVARYLARRNISSAGTFKALRAHTLKQILEEDALYRSIQTYLASKTWTGRVASDVRREVQRHVVVTPGLEWAHKPERRAIITEFLRDNFGAFVVVLILSILAFSTVPPILAYVFIHPIHDLVDDSTLFFAFYVFGVCLWLPWFIVLRIAVLRIEESFESEGDYPSKKDGYFEKVKAMEDSEDWGPQNAMSLIVTVKTSPLRIANLKFVMTLVRFACKYFLFKGDLGGIVSIHFANWVFINNDKRILFFSSYDGSWEAYLAEFLGGRALLGFNAIYSNTRYYPKTTFLVGKGAKRQARMFKEMVRERGRVTDFWYAAYDHLSVSNILINAAVRQGLWGDMSEDECTAWLQKF